MRGYNRAVIAGNLTRDPEVRYTVNKKAYTRFGVAVNSRWKNANGELQDNTEYINIIVWGPMAENCGKYLKKGSPVLVEGRIQTSSYEAKDGSGKRYTTEINADNVLFLGSGQGQGGGDSSYSSGRYGSSQPDMPQSFGVSQQEGSDFGSILDHGFDTEFSQGTGGSNGAATGGSDDSDIPF